METRKVTIINSKTQSQKIIQDSKATTLGELKQEMRNRSMEYTRGRTKIRKSCGQAHELYKVLASER